MLEVQSSRHANDDIRFVEELPGGINSVIVGADVHGVTPFLSCKTFVSQAENAPHSLHRLGLPESLTMRLWQVMHSNTSQTRETTFLRRRISRFHDPYSTCQILYLSENFILLIAGKRISEHLSLFTQVIQNPL